MKRMMSVVVVVLLIAVFSSAQSRRSPRVLISIGGGLNVPIGEFDDQYNMGVNAIVSIEFFLHKNFCLFLNSGADSFKYDSSGNLPEVLSEEGGDYKLYSLFAGVKGVFSTNFRLTFYALTGVGFCMQKCGDYTYTRREHSPYGGYVDITTTYYNKFREGNFLGITAGGGLEFEIIRMLGLFLEVRVFNVFTSPQGKPDDWPFLDPEIYEQHPDAFFFPIRLGVNIKI